MRQNENCEDTLSYTHMIEFHVSVFFKHLYFDASVMRDIHIVSSIFTT